jgi:hypothetical protein
MWRQGVEHVILLKMEIQKILAQLKEERDQMNEAILSLERLAARDGGKRRGRPPLRLQNATAAPHVATDGPKRRGRPPGSRNKS